MEVILTPELDSFVHAKISTGHFTSPDDVVREALRLMEESERTREEEVREFNEELGRRLASLDRGEYVSAQELKSHMEQRSREHRMRTA